MPKEEDGRFPENDKTVLHHNKSINLMPCCKPGSPFLPSQNTVLPSPESVPEKVEPSEVEKGLRNDSRGNSELFYGRLGPIAETVIEYDEC